MDNPQEGTSTVEESTSKKCSDDPVVLSPNALKAILTECLGCWITYLQVLNQLCSAGYKLSQCLGTLAQFQTVPLASQCQSSWEELSKATIIASTTVKTHIAAAMQDMIIGETYTESDAQRQQEHNQHIIFENLLTFINLQYQFSIASCECFGSVAMCPCCQTVSGGVHDPDCSMATLQQCFARLYTQDVRSQNSSPHSIHQFLGGLSIERGSSPSQAGDTRGSSPLHAPEMFRGPSPTQTFIDTIRTSVTSHIENLRGPFPTPGALYTMKSPFARGGSRSPLHFPLFPLSGLSGQRRWSEAAAGDVSGGAAGVEACARRWSMPWDNARQETGWMQRGREKEKRQQERNSPVEPPAACNASITGSDGLAEAIQLLGSRGMRQTPQIQPLSFSTLHAWPDSQHSEDKGLHRKMHPIHSFPRGNWQLSDIAQGTSVTQHYDIFPTNLPLTSRKSSSSTDSSSCLSIHSRSTSGSERGSNSEGGGPESMRLPSNLYSIWSGSDHLPFIRLPESQEPPDDSEDEKGSMSALPKPS